MHYRMNIGFDLDNVFISTPPFIPKEIIDKLYKKKDNGVLLYRIPSLPEQLFRRSTHMNLLRPAIKENLEFLKTITKKDNKLYLISSRFKFLEKRTRKIIKKYSLDKIFNEMYFNFGNTQPHIFKNEIIKKLDLDLYIDDDLSLIKHVAKDNTKTRFFWLNNNNQKQALSNNIFAIPSLSEIFEQTGIRNKESGIMEQ